MLLRFSPKVYVKKSSSSTATAWDFFVVNIERTTGRMRPVVEFVHGRARRRHLALLWLLFVPLLSLACYLLIYFWRLYEKRRYGIEWTGTNDSVLQYLDNFKDDRVELHIRHSATGKVYMFAME